MTIAWLPFALYAAAAAAYLAHFSRPDERTGRLATALLGGAVLAHTFLIGMQTMEAGYAPLVGTTAAVSAFVWLLGPGLSLRRADHRRAGDGRVRHACCWPRWPCCRRSTPQIDERPALLRSPLFTVHVLSMLFAYASFALAFVLGITYVLLFKEIKAKHLGFFYARLPSLQTLDVMNARAIVVGWLFLTCGLVVGGVWATQIGGSPDPRAQAMSRRRSEDPRARSCRGPRIRSRCSRGARSAGAAAAPRGCRRSRSSSCC